MYTAMKTQNTLGPTVPIAQAGSNAFRTQVRDINESIETRMGTVYRNAVRSKVWSFIAVMLGLLALGSSTVAQTSTPLGINCPPNRTNWLCGVSSFAFVSYPLPTTTGSCPTNATITCTPPSGGTFILGTTTVNCRATNSCRQSATCSFTITVARDNVPPVIQCPTNRIIWLCGTASTARVSFPLPAATDNADTNVVVSCSPPSNSAFQLGTSTVTCTATDDCTNRTACTFTVTLARDTSPPVIQCPPSISVTSCAASGAVVNYPTPTATDNADFNVAVTCAPASGSVFPLGTTTVTCTATDDCTNRTTCTFLVRVARDTTPPDIRCPDDIAVQTCDRAGVVVNYPPPGVADAVDPNPQVSCTPPSGSLFPLGRTMVTCEAVDACTNRSRCTFTVTVSLADTNPPSLNCPNNVVAWTCETNGAVVNYPAPTAVDDFDRSPAVSCLPPSGSLFPVGVTVVTCTAEDDCGNTTNCVFTVTVNRDTVPPQLDCPEQVTGFTCDPAGLSSNYLFVDASDNHDPHPTLICIPPAGTKLPPGTNVVTCVAIDSCSNRTECAFSVVVILDNVPPVIQCPPDMVVRSCDPGGVRVEFPDPQISDNNAFQPTASCVPHSGSIFPIGVTKVTCTATDHCDNRSQCLFTVTVKSDISLTNAPGIDTDGNGLSDIWEIHFNTGSLEPNTDSDGDGMSNAAEAGAGTNPLDPASSLRIDSIEPIAEGGTQFKEFTITKKTDAASTKLFRLQFTTALGEPWADLGAPKRGNGISVEFRVRLDDTNLPPTVSTQAFFRVAVSDVDEDGDGLTAWEESILGTSDLSPNTHGGRGGDHGAGQQHAAENLTTTSRLREVALAHVGGTPQGPTQTKLVTAAGTGGAIQLSSWTVDLNTDDPVHLLDAPAVVGFNTKLHVLTPPTSPSLSLNLFVHGRIGSEGNLWLTVYKVAANGAFSELSTLGYGVNASVRVLDFAMAHRPLFLSGIVLEKFQLVTPIICTNTAGQLDVRVLSWTVHPNSGQLIATYDSGDLGRSDVPRDGGSLQCAHLRGGFFTFNYSTAKNVLSSWFAEANDAGVVFQRGGAASGLDNLGKKPVAESATTFALGGLNPRGFVTALLGTNCNLSMITWEERVVACDAGHGQQPRPEPGGEWRAARSAEGDELARGRLGQKQQVWARAGDGGL